MNGQKDVLYTHTHTHTQWNSTQSKKEIMPFALTWLSLEIITLRELRQKKTNTISFICGT